MGGPEILVPISFFATVVVLVLGVPLVRARIREHERRARGLIPDAQLAERMARIEATVDAIALEVERISEGQRFVTKLLAEKAPTQLPPPRE